ncbi:hypothetical protein [Chitinophaga pinensis]|nr:hypothetical protein [Chitinophaga pinensis]
MQETAALTAQGFNEGKGKPFSAEDIRFTRKGERYMLLRWVYLEMKY